MNGHACVFVRTSVVRMCAVPVRGLGMKRTCVFVYACECGTHVYSTRTGPEHGCVLPTGRGVPPEFILGLFATFSRVRAVRCSARAVRAVYLVCVCVCTAVGVCSPSVVPLAVSTYMRALYSIWHGGLGGVGSIHECYLHVCTVRVPLKQCLAWLVRVMYSFCSCLYCDCTIAQCVLCLSPCTVCSGMASTGSVPTYPRCTRTVLVPSHSVYCACTPCTATRHGQPGQCMCILCLYLLYSGLAWPARVTYI